ncbi:MAG: alpha/beta fold hydrolase [Fluviicola sp.]
MKALVLLHGALGSDANLTQIAQLLSTEYSVYPFCFSGHGNKDFSNNFGIDQFSEELQQFISENKLEQPTVFGFSMGGYVALKLEAKLPGTFEKIITLGTKFDWTVASSEKEASLLNPSVLEEKVPAYAAYLKQLHGDSWEELVGKTAQMMLEMGQHPPLSSSDLKNITCPVICGRGENDKMVRADETIEIVNQLANGTYEEVPKWIHPIERLDADELAKWIKTFI